MTAMSFIRERAVGLGFFKKEAADLESVVALSVIFDVAAVGSRIDRKELESNVLAVLKQTVRANKEQSQPLAIKIQIAKENSDVCWESTAVLTATIGALSTLGREGTKLDVHFGPEFEEMSEKNALQRMLKEGLVNSLRFDTDNAAKNVGKRRPGLTMRPDNK